MPGRSRSRKKKPNPKISLAIPGITCYNRRRIDCKEVKTAMKENIHPDYQETTITCACGNVIHTRSTKKDIKVEICSKCHPFFTGKQKLVDTSGRVDMFKKRYGLK